MTLSVASNFEAIDLFFPFVFGCLASLVHLFPVSNTYVLQTIIETEPVK